MSKCEFCEKQAQNANEIKKIDGKTLRIVHVCDDCAKKIKDGLKRICFSGMGEEF